VRLPGESEDSYSRRVIDSLVSAPPVARHEEIIAIEDSDDEDEDEDLTYEMNLDREDLRQGRRRPYAQRLNSPRV